MLQKTINLQSATSLKNSISLKLGLELWQLFTALAVIFSLTSTMMWLGLVNPRNMIDQVNQVDRAKAFVYNQYQQNPAELDKIEISQSIFDLTTCTVKQNDDNTKNYKKIRDITDNAKINVRNELEKINKNPSIFQTDTNISKTYISYINILNSTNINIDKLENFQIKKSDFLNKTLLLCQDNDGVITKKEIVDAIHEMEILDLNNKTTEQLISLKNKIASSNVDNSSKIISYLPEINAIQLTVKNTLSSTKTSIAEFENNIKKVETWEKRMERQNPNINFKSLYIYDA
ncbi:MAG: hypothetical protein H7196_00875 [candidate division SR1 bacterium]|nr:hypothetical protein [candidate division SR1 bacterium]